MKINKHSNRKRRMLLTLTSLGVAGWIFVTQFYTATNYPDQNYPYYSDTYALANSKPVKNLTVVSYNIWFAEAIDQAISEMRMIESQNGLDIILLQEMDEVGTEKIARELQMNYVYFPAAIEPTYDKNFGNAILSKWPIVDAQKLILPHKSLSNRMNRIATKAKIRINNTDVLVYSLHTESIFTLPQFREDQYTAVLDDVNLETRFVIIGGDFNSFTDKSVGKIEDAYKQAGFLRASEGSGGTVIKYGIELASDHIFTKGFVVEEVGKLAEAMASDHLPIWVKLTLNR